MGRFEVRVGGFGGQGVITLGYLLGNAASIHDGKYVVMTQSYGPEARGGSCRSDIVISDEPIDYPKITGPDCLVAMNPDAYYSYKDEVKPGGAVLFDGELFKLPLSQSVKGVRYYNIPAQKVASELKNPMAANIVMLGALVGITRCSAFESVRKAVAERFPKLGSGSERAAEGWLRVGG
jgi:2-oxoglutarate ferredoxin oxidoreductase subunit gamma